MCGAGSSSSRSRVGAFLSLVLSFRASPLFYFLEGACDVTAVYEAMLMENFAACGVGFLMYAQKGAGERWGKKAGGGENEKRHVCGGL